MGSEKITFEPDKYMHTNGTAIERHLDQAIANLTHLSHMIYTPEDITVILVSIGTRFELFFKAILFPSESPRCTAEHFINCLNGLVAQPTINTFHALRRTYNSAKHDPSFTIGLIEAQQALKSAKDALSTILPLGLGLTNQPASTSTKRVYWLAAWDHYIGGDTEIHIMVPAISKHYMGPPGLDMIYIEALKWDEAKAALAAAGCLHDWKGHIPDAYVSAWQGEGDFLAAHTFEGEYRNLIISLGQFEKRQTRLPGLNRADSAQNVFIASLMALADISASPTEPDGMADKIVKQITTTYALPDNAHRLDAIVQELVSMVRKAPWSDVCPLIGPVWASKDEFSKLNETSIVTANSLPVIVDVNRRLVAISN